ncbi:uncharacterized protein LOC133516635 [Cydia pomonella]|uniref:uncharacterized protein LOC133516635 n=1 Tax=Cydia pomonella TaxID=82600 RepID=UPI002ADD7F14|nr:uncharacterized protein LOC133516635 [Cydia pomonella]
MWPPVSELLMPLPSTTTEVTQNENQPELQGSSQTVDCRTRDRLSIRRSLRRVARTEPLYRRANDVRQQPYTISGTQRHSDPAATATADQDQTLQLGITIDDIQAAGILMLFSKSHTIQGGELSSHQEDPVNPTTQSAMLSNNSSASLNVCIAPTNWLQTLRRQPRQRLLRVLRNLSIPPFDLTREVRVWKSDVNNHLMMSCMMVTHVVPSVPVPLVLQQAMHVAGQLVNLAYLKKMPKEQDICCADCGALPALPVTGQCGHTRCIQCIKSNSSCTCGEPAPAELHVDTCVQHLIGKILSNKQPSRVALRASERPPVRGQPLHDFVCAILGRVIQENCQALARRRTVAQRLSRGLRVSLTISPDSFTAPDVPARLPMTPQARVLHACELIRRQRYLEAAPHLARAATYKEFDVASKLLVQTIALLLEEQEPEQLTRELSAAVGGQAADTWLTPADLECVLCRDAFVAPVTTPCGHTYCRSCIACSLDYRKACPLCMRDLTNFNLALTRTSGFISAALASINLLPPPPPPHDPNVVPVFICVTAFPKVPCPLLISAPCYRVFIRRILESGSRRLGIVARNEDHTDSYGTMLEVRDCVECGDGRIILSTIGVSRFKIVERLRDSCLARVETLTDKIPEDHFSIGIMRDLGLDVVLMSLLWLKNLKTSVLWKLERAFGKMPLRAEEEWWRNPDGPDWLWWLVASLPLAPELQSMMIASNNLLSRLRVMQRTLQLVTNTPATGPFAYSSLRNDAQ